ncbi:MAG: pitrilysin family protein [Myxococcota bacterium]|nr:pitrilysin family protein [Myxococcota bacterium]
MSGCVESEICYQRDGVRVDRYVLTNGLRVLIWEDHRVPLFAYQTWFRVGSRHEQPGRTGMAHLFEHMMFKATSNHGEGEFDRIMEQHGAETNAATWEDWTYYRQKLPSGNLDLVCGLEADRMENLILDHDQLESEREVVINERLLRVDNDPEGLLYEKLYALAFGRSHPYGWPTIGWMDDIRAITLEDCQDFYGRYYAPNNATITLVGDVNREEALETIVRHYGHLNSQPIPEERWPEGVTPSGQQREVMRLPLSTERLLMAWRTVEGSDPRLPALEVLDEILTGGISSRLYRPLVTDQEIASDVDGVTPDWTHEGLYELSITLRPGKSVAEAEAVVNEELERAKRELVSDRELQKAKNCIEADYLRGMAGTSRRARGLGDVESTLGDFRFAFEHMDQLQRVTPEEIQRAATELLTDSALTVVTGESGS